MKPPHPAQFTKGSKWRFHSRREIWNSRHLFSVGDTIEVMTPLDNVSKLLACRGDIWSFMKRSDETKYASSDVTGTVGLDQIARFVERVEPGTKKVYYLRKCSSEGSGEYGHFYQGKTKNYPNTTRFTDAKYWENRLLALKAMLRENWFSRPNVMYEFYKLMSYCADTDQHEEIHIPEAIRRAVDWMNLNVVQRDSVSASQAMLTALLQQFDDFKVMTVVRMPRHDNAKELREACLKMNIRKPLAIADRYAVIRSVEEALLLKMALKGYEVIEVGN
jgi:hypothetical protein